MNEGRKRNGGAGSNRQRQGLAPENGPPWAPPPPTTPTLKAFATCCCNGRVTTCPGATDERSTLDRMAHAHGKVGDSAHSGRDGREVPKRGSSGVNRGEDTATETWEMHSGGAPLCQLPAGKRSDMESLWLCLICPSRRKAVKWDILLLEARLAFVLPPGWWYRWKEQSQLPPPPFVGMFPPGLPVIVQAPVATETVT